MMTSCVNIALNVLQSGRLKETSRPAQLQAAFYRSLKLFVLGMATQAGTDFPTYDLKYLRIMGILQRVALCYLVVAVSEILLPKPKPTLSKEESSGEGCSGGAAHMGRFVC